MENKEIYKSKNLTFWSERDEQGREIHGGVLKDNINLFEYWRAYDERGNEIHYYDSNGVDEQIEYNEFNHVVSRRITENGVLVLCDNT